MLVSKPVGKLCPVFFVEGFLNPALEGAKIVDCDFGNVGKEEMKVLDDVVWINGHPTGRILSQHDISICCCCAGRSGEAHTIFSMKSICRAAIMLPTQGM